MITLILASLIAGGRQNATYSYVEPAAPLSRLMPALAKALDQPLEVSPALASDVVCIDVHDVTSKELLDRLAWATGAEWEQTKSGAYTLISSGSIRTRQAAEELKRRADQIQKSLNPTKPSGPDPMREDELDTQSLLRLIDPMVLASIPEGTRAVFSTRPNRLQLPFMTDISKEVNEMIAKNNEEAEKAKLNPPAENGLFRSQIEPITGTVDKVLLAVTPVYFGDDEALQGQVRLYDKDGKDITGNHGYGASADSPDEDADGSNPLTLSHESKLFAQFVATETGGLGMMEMLRYRTPDKRPGLSEDHRAEAVQRFLAPDRYDPLAYVADLLRSLAHATNEQVVACVPDSFACNIGLVFEGQLTEKSLRSRLLRNKDMDIRSENGWLTGRPRDPAAAEAERLDRKRLAQVLELLQTSDYLRLADQEAIAKLGFDLHQDSLVNLWCTLARPTYFASDEFQNWDMVRLFATLSDQQQQALEVQHAIPLEYVTPEQTAILNRLVYGPNSRMFLHPQPGSAGDGEISDPEMTELLPNGLPTEMRLTLTVSQQPAVQSLERTGPKFRHVLGAEPMSEQDLIEGAAKLDLMKSHVPEDAGDSPGSFRDVPFTSGLPKELRSGSLRELEFGIQVLRGLFGSTTLEDFNMSGSGTISYAQLKTKLKARYDEAYQFQETISSIARGAGGSGGGTSPPPPPR